MFIKITDSETADNKGSSGALIHYLEKENRLGQQASELWFTTHVRNVPSHEAQLALDNNVAKLMRTEAKFFLVNISPSQKEIAWLKENYGERGAEEQLKAYAVKAMDEYARNFKRPGIESSKDLLWFGKLEHYRYYSYKDADVKSGLRKRGDRKPGEQMHIQVVVSRKDFTNTIKLSPMNKSRGKNSLHSKKVGQFDRSAFKQIGERLFDKQFGFDRELTETFQYANTQNKGTLEERIKLRQAVTGKYLTRKAPQSGLHFSGKLAISMARNQPSVAPSVTKPKKRKKKGQDSDNELSL